MTVRLSCSIMAHPSREVMVSELVDMLDRPVEVVWDEINDRHDTGIRAIEAHDSKATHHLVLQDDVLPCPDLLEGTERALAHVPEGHPASLYIGRVRPFAKAVQAAVDLAHAASWITMQGIYWGPAIVVPVADIEHLSAFYRARRDVTNYDRRVSTWYEARHLATWYTWPNLVDHRGAESIAHPTASPDRRAHCWIGSRSALDVDWSGDAVHLVDTDRMDVSRQRRAAEVVA